MKKVLIAVASLLLVTNSYAGCHKLGCEGSGNEGIRSVYPTTREGKEVVYLEAGNNKEYVNCTLVENQYLTLKSDHPAFRSMYATVLSAIALNKKFYIRVKENTPECEVAYVRMWH